MYDPTEGRWLSEDPDEFDAGDTNLYRYVGNKPTNATDPSGTDEVPLPPKLANGEFEKGLQFPGRVDYAIVAVFLSQIDNVTQKEFESIIYFTLFRIDPDPKTLITRKAFEGGAGAITLPYTLSGYSDYIVIASPKSIRPTGNDGAINDYRKLAIVAHEFQHVVQIIRDKDKGTGFVATYLSDYLLNKAKGMSEQDAYELIPFEIEGFAVQKAIETIFANRDNRTKFDALIRDLGERKDVLKKAQESDDAKALGKLFKEEYEKEKKTLTDKRNMLIKEYDDKKK